MLHVSRIFRYLFLLAIVLPFLSASALAEEKVWRVLYVEGGPFSNYQKTLAYTARGLEELGLLKNAAVQIPENSESSREMWEWLARNASGRLKFVEDAHYTADWDMHKRLSVKNDILERLETRGDIDMIIAMGTWSGADMAEKDLGIPVFSMSVTDAVSAGIVDSASDSGKDNVHAQLEPGRFRRQLSMFHEIFKFKRLGIPFEDTPEGRNTCAMDELEAAAEELGIELVRASAPLDVSDEEQAFRNLKSCVDTLLEKNIDALYLTYTSTPMHRIPGLIKPVSDAGIPSFAQAGPDLVKYGVLLSLAQASFKDIGAFEAQSIAAVVGGKKPREVNQVFEPELGLAVNLKSAMQIGWYPPMEILVAVDEIYKQIGE